MRGTEGEHRYWVIVAPTRSEYGAAQWAIRHGSCQARIDLRLCGIGPVRAERLAAALAALPALDGVALLGWAGALAPDLGPGAIVVADAALSTGRPAIACQPLAVPGARTGPVLTVARALATPAAKAAAASSGALAVEMEAYPLAAWAAAHHVPFVHARVILDCLNELLPDLPGAFGHDGYPRPLRLLAACAARPALARDLWRFNRRVRLVDRPLRDLAAAVLAAC